MDIRKKHNQLSVRSYQTLRSTVNWACYTDSQVRKALMKDLYNIEVYVDNHLAGMGRVIGDGIMYIYIQDLIVAPKYRRQGIGQTILREIENFLNSLESEWAFIGLMAAANTEVFYQKMGYSKREENAPGMYKYFRPG